MFWALSALAQFPFPGQQYPGGGYPGGYPGRRAPQQQQQQQPQNSRRSNRPVTITTEGMLRRVAGNQLVIEADDHRVIWYRLTAQTTSQKNGNRADVASFQPGDRVNVESSEDDDGNYTATAVEWERAGTADDKAAARETWDMPGLEASSSAPSTRRDTAGDSDDDGRPILRRKSNGDDASAGQAGNAPAGQAGNAPPPQAGNAAQTAAPDADSASTTPATQISPPAAPADPDDPGRPVLRRGGAAAVRQPAAAPQDSASNSTSSGALNGPPAGRPTVSQPILPQEDPQIEKAREAAYTFVSSLPNFFCQQITTRYGSQNPRQGWDTIDVVTADVAYQNGQESYKNIKATGKGTVQSMDQLEGTRSTGEFSSMLQDLMSPATGAAFRRSVTDSIHGRSAVVFKLEIPRERSHWRIEAPSQLYYPAIRGSIWVDRETSRVLRIEMEAYNLPSLFPFDTVEAATDYDFIRLAAAEQEYLLPADAEVLNCERGSTACSRNRIEFHNYRKFDAATSITFK
jgi:hypothetical protein